MFLCCRSYIVGMRTTVSTTKNWRNVSVSVAMWWWWECVTRSLFIWRSFASLRLCSCEGRRRSGNRRAWWRREGCLRRVLSTRRGTNLFSHRHRRNGSRSWWNGGLYGTGEIEGEEGTLKHQSPLRLIIVIHQQVSFQIVGVAPKRSGSTMIVTNRSFDWSGVLAIARWWGIIWIIGWHLIYQSLQANRTAPLVFPPRHKPTLVCSDRFETEGCACLESFACEQSTLLAHQECRVPWTHHTELGSLQGRRVWPCTPCYSPVRQQRD